MLHHPGQVTESDINEPDTLVPDVPKQLIGICEHRALLAHGVRRHDGDRHWSLYGIRLNMVQPEKPAQKAALSPAD
jgi:hypothetical protein